MRRIAWHHIPGLLLVVAVVLAPLLALLVAAFAVGSGETDALADLLGGRKLLLLGRSLALAVAVGCVGTGIGLGLGAALSRLTRSAASRWLVALCVPLSIPPFVVALAWIAFCDRLGVTYHGFGPTVLLLGLSFSPLAALLVCFGLRSIPPELVEAAAMGRDAGAVFRRIELAAIRPYLVTAFVLIALFSFSDYGVPSLLRVNTYPVVVFSQFAAYYDLRAAMISAWPYIALPCLVLLLWERCLWPRIRDSLNTGPGHKEASRATTSHRWPYLLLVPYVTVAVAIPVASLAMTTGNMNALVRAWKTARDPFGTTMGYCALAAAVVALMGAYSGWCMFRERGSFRGRLTAFIVLLPVALPGTLFGIGLISLWNHPRTSWAYGTPLMLLLLYGARFLPFAALPVYACLKGMGTDELDAARLGDASGSATFGRVVLPRLFPAVAIGSAACFLLAARELTGTLLIMPPGVETLAVRIYSLYHYGAGQAVAALSLFLVAASCAISLLAIWACRLWTGQC